MTTILLTDEIATPIGTLLLAARDGRLCSLDFDDCRRRMSALLASRYGSVEHRPASDPFGFATAVRAYLDGDLAALDGIPIETNGTEFQRRVWNALRRIPSGTTVTYRELACHIGSPRGSRAVGAANGRNPIAIVVPCHRMIGADGSLTGYAGGLWRKRWLLGHEGVAELSAAVSVARRGI